jgi:hypothetical protein
MPQAGPGLHKDEWFINFRNTHDTKHINTGAVTQMLIKCSLASSFIDVDIMSVHFAT